MNRRIVPGALSSSFSSSGGSEGSGHYKGFFNTSAELTAAYPTGVEGDYALIGDTDTFWAWDGTTSAWLDTGHGAIVSWGGIGGTLADQLDLQLALNGKVNTEIGKGLSSNDYTTDEKNKLSGVAENANNYAHPANHPPAIITQDANNRFVTDAEKGTWNGKQDALGFTPENVANKKTTLTDSVTDYASTSVITSRFTEADETHYNGLLEAENFVITYDETTRVFTVTLAADQQIALSRRLYTVPAGVYTTDPHADASKTCYLLFNGTTFICSDSFNFGTQVILAYVTYNATTKKGILFDERHPADKDKGMPPMVHAWLHFYQGALLESGGAVTGYTLNDPDKADMQPVIEETKIVDESLKKTLAALAAGTYKTAYRSGTVASGEWTYTDSDTPIRYDGSNNPIHNDISGVNALSTAISANNRWLNVYVIATNAYDAAYQYLWIQPQTLHTSETAAFDEDFLTAVNWGDKPVAEIVPLAKLTFRRQTGAMNFRIVRVENIRGTKVSLATTTSVSIHNNLGGRSAVDAHPVSSVSNVQNEILPIEIFEDGAVPPAELNIIDGKRYRDFTVGDDADLYVLKRANYNNPNSVRLVMVISNATAPAAGETIDFEVSINGGAAVTLSYVGLGTEAQNDVIVTDFESVSFGTGNYTVSLERVAGTYAQEIGVMAVEVN